MSIPEIIVDLSDDDDIPIVSSNLNTLNKGLIIRPASSALKHLGLNLIKMQYLDNSTKTVSRESVASQELNKRDLWESVWTDETNFFFDDQFRYMIEERFEKTYRCSMYRNQMCLNPSYMTRINLLHHNRQGHIRVNLQCKASLKNDDNPYNVIEIFCLLCPDKKQFKNIPLNPITYLKHMKKNHPNILPFKDHFAYFQRCFICNDQTKSYHHNLSHRKLCIGVLLRDPNQVGTEQFNNCFRPQSIKLIHSLSQSINRRNNFQAKLKLFNNLKCSSLYSWIQLRKNSISNLSKSTQNGFVKKPTSLTGPLFTIRENLWTNKQFMNCTPSISIRVAPGSKINQLNQKKFFIPVPFLIKNNSQSKIAYVKWRKSVNGEFSELQSNAPWYCELCNAMMKNVRSAYCHLKMCHRINEYQESSCKSCGKKFLTGQGYRNHFNGMKKCPVTRRCMTCDLLVSINDIYEHMYVKHKDDFGALLKMSMCLICRENVDNVRWHLFDIHGMSNVIQAQPDAGKVNYRNGVFFNCIKCSLTYFTELELRNHILQSEHYLDCVHCPSLRFSLSWELMHHLSVCHNSNQDNTASKFTCEYCQPEEMMDKYHGSSDLIRHYIKAHLTPCSVLLTDVTEVN